MLTIHDRQRQMLRHLWSRGPMSRWQLHLETGVNPNAVGSDAAALLGKRIIRELPAQPHGPGRPQVPLEIDPTMRHVVGVAIGPGRVQVARISLRGMPVGAVASRELPVAGRETPAAASDPAGIVPAAAEMLGQCLDDNTLAIGVSVTGSVDPSTRRIISSSSVPDRHSTSLDGLYDAAGEVPVILENNMHALAARWLLREGTGFKVQGLKASVLNPEPRTLDPSVPEDVLLVQISDGQLGAAMLIDGRPNSGCTIGANELGHSRFFIDTDLCYCGHAGCLERICSTGFLRRNGVAEGSLLSHATDYGNSNPQADAVIDRIVEYLAVGLSNAINLIRPHRLVLVSELSSHEAVYQRLLQRLNGYILPEIVDRVQVESWEQVDSRTAETAGWIALASLYHEGWLA